MWRAARRKEVLRLAETFEKFRADASEYLASHFLQPGKSARRDGCAAAQKVAPVGQGGRCRPWR